MATGSGPVLLPFEDVDAAGVDAAVDVVRVALAHRDLVAGRQLIGTVRCSVELLEDSARALPLPAACGALAVDGWRIKVVGLQQDCGSDVIRRTREAALALAAGGATVWVRTAGLSRWAMAAAGLPIAYRAGRGLWTRPSNHPRIVPERVEVPALAGPVSREVAERLALWRPDLVACDCRACGGRLPAAGGQTVLHNVLSVAPQLRLAAQDPSAALRVLDDAARLRGELAGALAWSGELKHVAAVRVAVEDFAVARPRRAGYLSAN